MTSLLRPVPFFIGLIGGLLTLALVGATIESEPLKTSFVRFHQRISPEASFYPTARQFISIARPPADSPDKVTVIIGGSSVFAGVGQEVGLVWTRTLQELLGPRYRVVNLSIRATNALSNGNIAAEWLLGQSKPVIFVANVMEPAHEIMQYLLFDAWQRGDLLPWPARDRKYREAFYRGDPKARSMALGAALNAYLSFNDLWSTVAYDHLTLIWNFLLLPDWYFPRSKQADPELTEALMANRLYRGNYENEMNIARSAIAAAANWSSQTDQTVPNIEPWMPLRLREVTLAVMTHFSPYYLRRVRPDGMEVVDKQLGGVAALLENHGINRALVATSDFTETDYVDLHHLSVAGGRKLADKLAPEIAAMAKRLGYIP